MFCVGPSVRVDVAVLAAVASCAASALGCAHDPAERHAKEHREGLTSVQAETDRASEREGPVVLAPASRSPDAGVVRPPITETIRLGAPEPDGEDDDPNAPTGRPKIELHGSSSGVSAPRKPSRPRDDARPTDSPARPGEPGAPKEPR